MLQYGLAALMLCSSAWLEAANKSGKTQKVIYPNGRVVYEPVPAKQAPQSATTGSPAAPKVTDLPSAPAGGVTLASQGAPASGEAPKPCVGCAPDGGGNPNPGGKCLIGLNLPEITSGSLPNCDGPPTPTVTTDNTPQGQLPVVDGPREEFYSVCRPFDGRAYVPVLKKYLREEYIFDKYKVTLPCCIYEVCVVHGCYCIDTRKCELQERDVKLNVCFRKSGDIVDVYVVDQPGMPKRWVLHLGITKAAYLALFPHGPQS